MEALIASQQQWLRSQVIMTDTVAQLARKVHAHEDRIQVLIGSQLRVDETLAYMMRPSHM